jgi:hypothetical protein
MKRLNVGSLVALQFNDFIAEEKTKQKKDQHEEEIAFQIKKQIS